jgi:hypothetical protein
VYTSFAEFSVPPAPKKASELKPLSEERTLTEANKQKQTKEVRYGGLDLYRIRRPDDS